MGRGVEREEMGRKGGSRGVLVVIRSVDTACIHVSMG